ncbi:MAG: hypothetical protein EZS26_001536, partial [Candidatus Ordinivivax streblomastigis]
AFVELRKYALGYSELRRRIDSIEGDMNAQFSDIYTILSDLETKHEENPRPIIGFNQP